MLSLIPTLLHFSFLSDASAEDLGAKLRKEQSMRNAARIIDNEHRMNYLKTQGRSVTSMKMP
jgi:hypothetical protein